MHFFTSNIAAGYAASGDKFIFNSKQEYLERFLVLKILHLVIYSLIYPPP
jgi:hypothetical protein